MKPSIHNLLNALNLAYDDEPQMLEEMGFEEPFMKLEARLKPESHWDEHPNYPVEDWKYQVANDDTRQSYREWVESQIEMEETL